MCGGTGWRPVSSAGHRGLSPRVRGNPRLPADALRCVRSIPACAGEPMRSASASAAEWVYPRVCGGTQSVRPVSDRSLGLSPRVRGNQGYGHRTSPLAGSIPACAGEPHWCCVIANARWVYPRVCGGTKPKVEAKVKPSGLSPRVRGNLAGRMKFALAAGSIPACAGEPAPADGECHGCRVYPRVCGGTVAAAPDEDY